MLWTNIVISLITLIYTITVVNSHINIINNNNLYHIHGGSTVKKSYKPNLNKSTKNRKRGLKYLIKSFFITMIDPSYVTNENGGNTNIISNKIEDKSDKTSKYKIGNKKGVKVGDSR